MALKIYNSQSHKKEEFQPIEPGHVRMYVCGPTVYDLLHIGNFRGAIFFNVVRSWLEKLGYHVNYVYNYTDVDDKIIDRAKRDGVSPEKLSQTYIEEFRKDYEALKLRPQSHNPRVTEYMGAIIEFIQGLVDLGKAYVVDGEVYYDVKSFSDYGKLSHKQLDDLLAGYRIEIDSRKKFAADFALWKKAKPGEIFWSSPWGEGRPGWHIECSAMSRALLGDTIDIHGGGLDLIFPHHENEIAQSEGLTGKPFVKYWMHNNMIQFGSQKMSKSLGNIITGRGFVAEYNPEIFKYMILSAHYRSPVEFSLTSIDNAISGLARIYSSLALAKHILAEKANLAPIPDAFQKALDQAEIKFADSLNDDFNTPEALAAVFDLVRSFNALCRKPGKITPEQVAISEVFASWVRTKGELLAILNEEPEHYLNLLDDMLLRKKNLSRSDIDLKVAARTEARTSKDFKTSDRIRDELVAMGIALQDGAEGTRWEVAK